MCGLVLRRGTCRFLLGLGFAHDVKNVVESLYREEVDLSFFCPVNCFILLGRGSIKVCGVKSPRTYFIVGANDISLS